MHAHVRQRLEAAGSGGRRVMALHAPRRAPMIRGGGSVRVWRLAWTVMRCAFLRVIVLTTLTIAMVT